MRSTGDEGDSVHFLVLRMDAPANFLSVCGDVQGWPGLPSGHVVTAGASPVG